MSLTLTIVYRSILKLSGQCHSSYLGDVHRIEILCQANVEYQWPHERLLGVASNQLFFQKWYQKLQIFFAALQRSQDLKSLCSSNKQPPFMRLSYRNWTCIGVRRWIFSSTFRQPRVRQRRFTSPRPDIKLFQLERQNTLSLKLRLLLIFAQATQQCVEFRKGKQKSKAGHSAFTRICHQPKEFSGSNSDEDDVRIFEEMVTTTNQNEYYIADLGTLGGQAKCKTIGFT